ncbi:MAG: CatA-like O-acetyltransferase [Rubrivivax sp.]
MRYLDLERWPRRASYEMFRAFDDPYFSVCTQLDLSALVALKARLPGSLTLAYHHLLLRAANELEPFRYRFDGDRVRVLDVVHGSMTVLQPDETITFAHLPYDADHGRFVAVALPQVRAAQRGEVAFDPAQDEQTLMHFTTLPWMDFTSFSHARDRRRPDAIPKVAFGRLVDTGRGHRMAIAIEVHHALMDGLHVGRLLQRVQGWLDDPAPALLGAAAPGG